MSCVMMMQTADGVQQPKRERDDEMRRLKQSLLSRQAEDEQRMTQRHKEHVNLEVRTFRRRKLLQVHQLEQDQLLEVSAYNASTSMDV